MDDRNVDAGDLNRRVAYYAPVAGTPDSVGQVDVSYPSGVNYWAAIRNLTGRELDYAQQVHAEADHVLVMRYPGFSFDPRGRFTYQSRTFNVSWCDHVDEAKRMVRVYCTEISDPLDAP